MSAARVHPAVRAGIRLRAVLSALAVLVAGETADGQRPAAGRATIALNGTGISLSGEYATTQCGGPYMLGSGMAYQTKAGDWQITVASETRASGKIPLNGSGGVNVVVTVNGPGKNFVRYPENGGSLTVSADFRKAEATLDLRSPVGKDTARLVATFTCQ